MPYPPKQAARLADISVASVKNYVARWPARFSPSATPGPGIARSYSDTDIRTLRTIARMSREGLPTQEINSRLAEGELDDWQPDNAPQEPISGQQQTPQPQAALALIQPVLQALQTAQQREDVLHARIAELERELGQAQGELSQLSKPWWRRLFGWQRS